MNGSFFTPQLNSGDSANGFWSVIDGVLPGVGDGIGKVTSEVFPRYVSSLLDSQQDNILDRELFNQAFAQPRVEQAATFSSTNTGSFSMKEIAIIGGVAILGLVVAFKI